MRSSHTFQNKGDFLVMTVSGQYHYWDFIKYPELVLKKCEAERTNKVLVDLASVNYTDIPTIELFFLGEMLAETLRDKIKMAIVWTGDRQERFLQTVATNRAACLRIFDTAKTAEFWLLYDKEDEPMNLFES